jgi:site-specific DNA-adenine methylase
MEIQDRLDWGELATFVPNKFEPVYNWFYYKEGFAKELVMKLVEEYGLATGHTVLDPFCGSGTTLLACKQLGINSIGLDVLPMAAFAASVKTQDYDTEKLREILHEILMNRFMAMQADVPSIMKRAFSKYALEDIIFFKSHIQRIEDDTIRNFFLLALNNAAMRISYAWKDGSVIKIKKKNTPPLKFMFKRTAHRMIKDLEKLETKKCSTIIEQCDARKMNVEDNSIDAVITSPPYLNKIEYTKIYEIENFILGGLAKPCVRSYLGLSEDDIEKSYFDDMNKVLLEMYRVMKKDAKAAIIVGNGYVNGNIVDSDTMFAEMAKKIGFHVNGIYVLNERFALENRTLKKGILRESLVELQK